MTHAEQRVWLIQGLLAENPKYKDYEIPKNEQEQKDLLRALMNVRMPDAISEDFLKIQDEYLQEENAKDGFVDIDKLTPTASDDRLYLWQGDITRLKADAIVNAANSQMLGCFQPLHSCIDNIIGSKAGIRLRLSCNDYMHRQFSTHGRDYQEPTGRAMITEAYSLPCKYILHTVGPIVRGSLTQEHERLLASCYTSCLKLADENKLRNIAFCCISTGVYMFPNQRAAEIAYATVRDYLNSSGSDIKVIFNVFTDKDRECYEKLI